MVKREIAYSEDSIHIVDEKGEVLMWTQAEWQEDPSLVFTIANACYLFGKGENLRSRLQDYVLMEDETNA